MLGLGLGLWPSGRSLSSPAFDPATLSPLIWTRAGGYNTADGTWDATAPATRGFNDAEAGLRPADGAAVNGHASIDFQGVDLLAVDGAAHTVVSLLGSTYTLLVLANLDALGADNAAPGSEKAILADSLDSWGLVTGASGARLWTFDGSGSQVTPYTALSTGAWTWVKAKKVGGSLYVGTGTNAWSAGAPSGNVAGGGGLIYAGYHSGGKLDAKVLEVLAFASEVSDANIANIVGSYTAARYAL